MVMVHSSNENNAKIKRKNSSVVILSLFYTATEYVQTQRLRHIFIYLPNYCYLLRFIKLCFSQTNISSWTKYINLIRKTAFFKLRHISTMWHYLIAYATKTLVGSLVWSWMNRKGRKNGRFPRIGKKWLWQMQVILRFFLGFFYVSELTILIIF